MALRWDTVMVVLVLLWWVTGATSIPAMLWNAVRLLFVSY